MHIVSEPTAMLPIETAHLQPKKGLVVRFGRMSWDGRWAAGSTSDLDFYTGVHGKACRGARRVQWFGGVRAARRAQSSLVSGPSK